MAEIPNEAVADWFKAKRIIEKFLKEIIPSMSKVSVDHNASALIARLAHENMIIDTVKETE